MREAWRGTFALMQHAIQLDRPRDKQPIAASEAYVRLLVALEPLHFRT